MAIFGVTVEHGGEESQFFQDTRKRLKKENLIENPFEGTVTQIEPGFYVLDLKPIYPNFTWVGWIGCGLALGLGGVSWWLLPGALVGLLGFAWTPKFFFLMMRAGLRKAGYRGPSRLLRNNETLRGVMNAWDK